MSITKNIRNRVVGILVVISIVLILLPFLNMNDKDNSKPQDDNAIAINRNGAVTDTNGQLVTAGNSDSIETNYSDMLEAPIDDTKDSANALSNVQKDAPASSPFDALNNNQVANTSNSNQATSDLEVPNDNMFASANLETATPTGAKNSATVATTATSNTSTLPSASTKVAPQAQKSNTVKTETLKSSRVQATQSANANKPKVQSPAGTAPKSNLVTGTFAAQIGVFSQNSYVTENVAKLKKAGFNAQTQSVNINGKSMVRVFAGTAKTRQAADAICRSAKAKVGLDCRILSL